MNAQARGSEPSLPQVLVAQQRFARQRFGLRAAQPSRRRRRTHGNEWYGRVEQALGFQPGPRAPSQAQSGVKAFALDIDQLLRRVDLERDAGIALAPAAHARQQPALRKRRQDGDPQALRRAGRRRGCGLHAVLELRQRRLHAAEQRAPRGIERDPASPPLEQLETKLLFEPADLLAHRAVRQVEHIGRGAQVLQLGDGTECGQGVERQARHARHAGKVS